MPIKFWQHWFQPKKKLSSSKTSFLHSQAQIYELRFAKDLLRHEFPRIWQNAQKAEQFQHNFFPGPKNQFFDNEPLIWQKFTHHCQNRPSLEIGSGPVGIFPQWQWVKKPIIIDPLIDKYEGFQKQEFGKTVFPQNIKFYAQPAEKLVPSLKNKISGFIICRNTLDHTEDPLLVLENISHYAVKSCYLLLWTDLWHLNGIDAGHRNITKSRLAFRRLLQGLGFRVLAELKPVRPNHSTVEYGCRAIKVGFSSAKKIPLITSHDPAIKK